MRTGPSYNDEVLSLSPLKLLVIAGVIMLVLGPDKLPEVAHKLGASWRTLKNLQERVEAEIRASVPDLPSTAEIARMARSPVNLLNQLADRVDAKEEPEKPTAPSEPVWKPPPPRSSSSPPRRAVPVDGPPDPSLN